MPTWTPQIDADSAYTKERKRPDANDVPAHLITLLVACAQPAQADEIRVLAAGAAKHAIEALAPAFERASGFLPK